MSPLIGATVEVRGEFTHSDADLIHQVRVPGASVALPVEKVDGLWVRDEDAEPARSVFRAQVVGAAAGRLVVRIAVPQGEYDATVPDVAVFLLGDQPAQEKP